MVKDAKNYIIKKNFLQPVLTSGSTSVPVFQCILYMLVFVLCVFICMTRCPSWCCTIALCQNSVTDNRAFAKVLSPLKCHSLTAGSMRGRQELKARSLL